MIEIIKAWFKWIFKKPNMESMRRFNICKVCKNNKMGVCKECGCVIKAKVRCNICGCNKWQ
jgi:hypothetical protein